MFLLLFSGLIGGIAAIFKGIFGFVIDIINVILEKISFLTSAIKADENRIKTKKSFYENKEKLFRINNEL